MKICKRKKNSCYCILLFYIYHILVETPSIIFDTKHQYHHAPTFIEPLRSQDIHIDSTVVFECIIYGEPTPYVTWEHDGVELCQGVPISDPTSKHQLYQLVLQRVQPSDCGEYACKARNPGGEATSVADLRLFSNQQQDGK